MKYILAALLCLSFVGCRSSDTGTPIVKNRETLYSLARIKPPLIIPAGLDDRLVGSLLVVPEQISKNTSLRSSGDLAAPTALLAPEVLDRIKVQRLGDNNWLVSPENPSTVWPKLALFMSDNNLGTQRTEPATGVLTTVWFVAEEGSESQVRQVLAADEPGVYRIEFRVEQAIKKGFTEVHAQMFKAAAATLEDVDLKATGVEVPAKEVELLKMLAGNLLSADRRISVSLMADAINTTSKAELLQDDNGQFSLQLNLDDARFFATVEQSLKNAEIPIDYIEGDKSVIRISFDWQLVDDRQFRRTHKLKKGEKEILDLYLRWKDQRGYIVVRGADAEPLESGQAEQVLNLLREYAL